MTLTHKGRRTYTVPTLITLRVDVEESLATSSDFGTNDKYSDQPAMSKEMPSFELDIFNDSSFLSQKPTTLSYH